MKQSMHYVRYQGKTWRVPEGGELPWPYVPGRGEHQFKSRRCVTYYDNRFNQEYRGWWGAILTPTTVMDACWISFPNRKQALRWLEGKPCQKATRAYFWSAKQDAEKICRAFGL